MKNYLAILLLVFFPLATWAAYNDVVLTTDADILVNGVRLDVSGSSANIESLTAGSGNFTVTLQAGSSFKVASPTLNKIDYSISGGGVSVDENCGSAAGYTINFGLSSGSAATVTVTPDPNTSVCGSSGGSGGGGGGAPPPSPPATPPATPQPPVAPPDRQALIVAIQAQIIQLVQQIVQQIQQMIQQLLSQLLSQLSQQLPASP